MLKKSVLAVVPLLLFLAGCASTGHARLKGDWKNPEFTGGKSKQILAVVLSGDPALREDIENQFMARTYHMPVEVISSKSLIPKYSDVTKEKLIEIVKQRGYDRILFTRPIIGSAKGDVHSYASDWYTNPEFGYMSNPWSYYSSTVVTFSPVDAPTSLQKYGTFSVETMLYDAATEKLLWSSTIEVTSSRESGKAGEEYTVTVWNRLSQLGFI